MKIQNISSVPIPVSLMKRNGETLSVNLGNGEFVYTDSSTETKSIIIQTKKGKIQTYSEEKPNNLEFFQIYSKDTVGSTDTIIRSPQKKEPKDSVDKYRSDFKIPTRAPEKQKEPKDSADKYKEEFKIPTRAPEKQKEIKDSADKYKGEFKIPSKPPITEPKEPEAKKNESTEQPAKKNKGGRPKGSKDKIKRGEPKLKKPSGRPINTENLQGMKLEDVEEKCESRGYSVRITNEDGKSYMVTHDLRFDRVNLEVEKGVVTKANIG